MTVNRLNPASLPDAGGHFGRFGGRFVPETLMRAALVGRVADGVIVGSAIVTLVERYAGSRELLSQVGDFIAAFKAPLREASA